jgi:CDP-diacylglycerol--glycerol-3-phosphate 3-phosphatidyltransferase
VEEAALADPRLACQEHRPWPSRGRVRERRPKPSGFGDAIDEDRAGDPTLHAPDGTTGPCAARHRRVTPWIDRRLSSAHDPLRRPTREGLRIDLYRLKPAIAGWLDPAVARLERAGVSPDAVTLAALPVAAIGGAAVLASPGAPALLLLVPVAVTARLVLNILDGALARRTGRMHARGELLNELGDRVADVLLLAPVALIPGAIAPAVWLGVVLAVLASFVSVATKAAGGPRTYRGILSKPGRMVLLAVFAVAALVAGPGAWAWFGPLLAIGAGLTLVERVVLAVRALP